MRTVAAASLPALFVALTLGPAAPAAAKEYLLTGAKPDKLVLIDPEARAVERVYDIPNAAPGVTIITPSPDGRIAYAVVNRWESVSGIDLDTGEEVFRADFSTPELRVKAIFGMDVSPDGEELYVFQLPVRLGLDEHEVQDTRIAVYNTRDGIGAEPVRLLDAPRRTAIMAMSKDGSRLYAMSWDIRALDPQTGEVLEVHGVRHWDRPDYDEPDVLAAWPQWEQTGVFSTPYFVARTDLDPEDPEAYETGLLTLDLETGDFRMETFETTEVVIFSSVISPVDPTKAFMVYTTLTKVDLENHEVEQRIDLDHTYYTINISGDGSEVYVGGTMDDIAVYDTETLEKIGSIEIPDGADMALASVRIIRR